MEYVDIDKKSGTVSWDRYFEYLEKNKDKFPKTLYEYASNWNHYSLNSPTSLHDAWLEKIELADSRHGSDVDVLMLTLLGASHALKHILCYKGLVGYSIDLKRGTRPGSRDLLAHEFRHENEHFAHEMRFFGSGVVLVEFNQVKILRKYA